MEIRQIRIEDIDETEYRMRLDLNDPEFTELAESVKRDGIIQPVILKPDGQKFRIVAGHRRTAAAKFNNLETVPAQVVNVDDRQAWNMAFTENLFRKDLTPIEEASCIKDCIDQGIYTVETIAKSLGRSVGWVLGRLELVTWPALLTQAIHGGFISVSAARWIAKIPDPTQVEMLTNFAIDNGATERATQAWYQSYQASNMQVNPEEVEDLPPAEKVNLPPPQSPCLICQKVHPVQNLSYLPICGPCGHSIVEAARQNPQA